MPRNRDGKECNITAIPQDNSLSAARIYFVVWIWLSFMRGSASFVYDLRATALGATVTLKIGVTEVGWLLGSPSEQW